MLNNSRAVMREPPFGMCSEPAGPPKRLAFNQATDRYMCNPLSQHGEWRQAMTLPSPGIGRRPLPHTENRSLFRVVAPTAWGLLLDQRMRLQLPVEALLTALALLVPLSPGHAAEPSSTPGQAMYLRYCGACHGPAGKGDGIAGTFITPKPGDLTQIAKKNGGTFPFQGVPYIDGTRMRDLWMPVGRNVPPESAWDGRMSRCKASSCSSPLVRSRSGQVKESAPPNKSTFSTPPGRWEHRGLAGDSPRRSSTTRSWLDSGPHSPPTRTRTRARFAKRGAC